MSNIKLVHSGGNSVSLTTPTSNPASNITFKLPQSDGSAGQVLQTDGNGNLSWVTPATTNGIRMADQWRRAAVLALNSGENFLTSDWERVDGSGQGVYIPNGGMTQSSGIFTFPMTGIYKVEWQCYFEDTGSASVNSANIYITTDNNTYTNRSSAVNSVADVGSYSYVSAHTQTFVDVTDTSQVKVKFRVYSNSTVAMDTSSSENRNCATFVRLGDT